MLETMRGAVATGRAGTPVSARIYLECANDTEDLDRELALAVDMLGQLFDSQVEMLTVFGSTDDIIKGLELGADDYLVKPFGVQELTARVSAVLRRVGVLT